jgi:AAA ATPase-like protein
MMVGRSVETEAVDRLLDDARAGRSGVLVVRGAAGIGKSALLDYAASRADGMTILRAVAVEAESELAFAGLHQVLRPLLRGIDALPEPQTAGLRSAFALSGEPLEGRFPVSLGALSLLADAAEERPLLCLIDDAHWLDGASADALFFAARRLEAESVALLFAVRDDETRALVAPGLPELQLSALARFEARAVLAELGPEMSPAAVEWVVDNANGNPLALVELPRSLSPRQRTGQGPQAGTLPPATTLEQAYLERVAQLPPPARAMLVIAAAEGTGDRRTIARAAAELHLDPLTLAAAEAADLVHVHTENLEFHHPLVRSAVYRAASFADRERTHRALAAVLDGQGDADRRAWHRAAATVGPDPEVADELERTTSRIPAG